MPWDHDPQALDAWIAENVVLLAALDHPAFSLEPSDDLARLIDVYYYTHINAARKCIYAL